MLELLAYFAYPETLRKTLRSTNLLEHVNKEMRRCFRGVGGPVQNPWKAGFTGWWFG